MTRQEFIERATRAKEKRLGIPPGWWGTWGDVRGPQGQRVTLSRRSRVWIYRHGGREISRHDSRSFAIAKARRV